MTDEEIVIAFGTNSDFVPHLAAAIASIVGGAPGARIRFLVLHNGVSEEQRSRTEAVAPHARFVWTEIGDNDVPRYAGRDHFSRPVLYRLALEKLAPADCRRVLYLDVDMTVCGDIRELWNYDLGGLPIGAVVDYLISPFEFAKIWSLPADSRGCFNSGVLIIDLDQIRAGRLFSAAAEFFSLHAEELPCADQDALNYALWGRWRPLPPAWNAQRNMVIPSIVSKLPVEHRFHDRLPEIVHYTGAEKPWILGAYHPWSWLYWVSLARTPFFDEVVRQQGIGWRQRLWLWVRWQRRKPRLAAGGLKLPARAQSSA